MATSLHHPVLPQEIVTHLRDGLAACDPHRRLTPEANCAIGDLCTFAREQLWAPEQMIVAVKEACYSSPEIAQLTTTSEREMLLSAIVSSCIQEYYRRNGSA